MIHFYFKLIFLVLLVINLCIFYGAHVNTTSRLLSKLKHIVSLSSETITDAAPRKVLTTDIPMKGGCTLQIPDPWDPSIRHLFSDEKHDYSSPKLPAGSALVTTFVDGVLSLINDSYSCKYRCFNSTYEQQQSGGWIAIAETKVNVSCEFFEVNCERKNGSSLNESSFQVPYRMTYAQAVRKQAGIERTLRGIYRPSVIIIVIDSLSHSSAVRRLSQTLKFLTEELNAIILDGYAKVGLNSIPNARAFLTGIMEEAPFGSGPDMVSGREANEGIIWNEYKKRNFITYFSEDDIINLLFDPFMSPPTDHFLEPFWTYSDSLGVLPQAYHRVGLTYLNQVLQMYQNNPLFVLSWMSMISHDQVNDLDDSFFLQFFKKSLDFLKDSFVILMSDHGMRFGELRSSVAGRLEDNLPFFSITLPEILRNRADINQNLQQNSKILTNHFDLYVTLWDLLTSDFNSPFSQQLNWTNFTPAVRGQSLLRPIHNNRTCQNLQMPLEYCPCYEPTKNCTDMLLLEKLAQFAVSAMNKEIQEANCEKIHLDKVLEAEELLEHTSEASAIYRIMLTTVPNNGKFQALLRHDKQSDSVSNVAHLVDRINRFDNMSYCVDNHTLKRYCLCKN